MEHNLFSFPSMRSGSHGRVLSYLGHDIKALETERRQASPVSSSPSSASGSSSTMSATDSINKEARDNYYVQTVNMGSAPSPPPQMAPYQRTYANPVRGVHRVEILLGSQVINCIGASGYACLRDGHFVLVDLDT